MNELQAVNNPMYKTSRENTALFFAVLFVSLLLSFTPSAAQKLLIQKGTRYLQNGQKPEWDEFADRVPVKNFSVSFTARKNQQEQTLHIRQYDVKQQWKVVLNDRFLGSLTVDENHLTSYLPVPAQALVDGENKLLIEAVSAVPDDIVVGDIWLEAKPVQDLLSECLLSVQVWDEELRMPIPSRITITDGKGALQTVGAQSNDSLAVRPGFVYTSSGKASFGLPAGVYTVYATRGFEYGVDSAKLVLSPGKHVQRKFSIKREVSTKGWINSDTHLHTLTYSGHGDATIRERLLAIAGEGVELPVITEHNLIVDVRPLADSLRLTGYFTPVAGVELTTAVGHFNLFPLSPASSFPNPAVKSWNDLVQELGGKSDSKVAILNHGRDIHKGFRPFDPAIHVALAGRRLDGQEFPGNAMEVINSGSQQTDRTRLLFDWFGMLNRGYFLTPVGSSDSHDVGRYLAGQARTYVKGKDVDPGAIDVDEAIHNFRRGSVMVSFGLLAEIIVNKQYSPGELAAVTDSVRVRVKVAGPGWAGADRVALYANGKKVGERVIKNKRAKGVKWEGSLVLPKLKHDVFLVAVAEGEGTHRPFWPIAKPYQPTSPHWAPRLMALSGAVLVDMDQDRQWKSAYQYAQELFHESNGNFQKFIKLLADYDEAVAIQAASLLHEKGWSLREPEILAALQQATEKTKKGFRDFTNETEMSRKER